MYPWETASAAWAGWIPTVSGHLSFSLIGDHTEGAKHAVINDDLPRPDGRVVIVHQRRRNEDFGFSAKLAEIVFKDTVQEYVLVGKTETAPRPERVNPTDRFEPIPDERGCLQGSIYWFPDDEIDERRNRVDTALAELDSEARRINQIADESTAAEAIRGVEAWARALMDPLLSSPSDDGGSIRTALKLDFALYRTGEFRLWCDAGEQELEVIEIVAKQVFYFVKGIAHAHAHHDEQADQMVHLGRITPTIHSAQRMAETEWRNETQWGLSRVFEQFHRRQSLKAQRRALGVLAYADAFQSSLAQVMREPGGGDIFTLDRHVALYDNNHRRESVKALIDFKAEEASVSTQLYVLLVTTLFASMGLWYGFVSIRAGLCMQVGAECRVLEAKTAAWIVALIVNSPITFFILCSLCVWTSFLSLTKDIEDPPLFAKAQSRYLRPFFAIANEIVERKNWNRRIMVVIVQAMLLFIFLLAVLFIGLVLRNQDSIRAVSDWLTNTDFLGWLP